MTIFITGICGFVGASLARTLVSLGSRLEIFGIDNLSRPGAHLNREALLRQGVKVWHGDIRLPSDLAALPAADWVIDAAANPSVLAGVDGKTSSRQLLEHNLGGTLNLLEYCKQHRTGLVLLSTSRVYSVAALAGLPVIASDRAFRLDDTRPHPPGITAQGVGEDFSTEPPLSLYGNSKRCSELLALEYGAAFDFPVWIDRCGVLAGAGQFGRADQGIFSYWIHAWRAGRPLRYIGFGGKGFQVRDAFHPEDLAVLIHAQMKDASSGGPRIWSLGGGLENAMSLARLSQWCTARFGPRDVACDPELRPFDIPWLVMDASRASQRWNWTLRRPLEGILEEIARHAEDNPEWLETCEA